MLSKRSKTPKRILQELSTGEKTLTELAEAVEISKQGVLKHLNSMEEEGMVESRLESNEQGRTKIFSLDNFTELTTTNKRGFIISFRSDSSLDPRYPLIGQIPQMEFREQLKEYLEAVDSMNIRPLSVVVFGSVARGEATWKSDIDVLFLTENWTEEKEEEIVNVLSDVTIEEEGVERSLNPSFRDYSDLDSGESLMEEVRSDGVLVYTTEEVDPTWKHLKRYRSI